MNLRTHVTGQGAPITLLHGFTAHGGAWNAIRARLERHSRVMTIDLPGHGGSPAPPAGYDFNACAADVVAAMHRGGQLPGTLLGYSMGGRVALSAALREPSIRGLILESASPGLDDDERAKRRAADDSLADRIETGPLSDFVDRWLDQPLFRSQQRLDSRILGNARAIRLENDGLAVAAALRCLGTGSQPSYWPHLADLRTPVLLISGELDEKFRAIAERMRQVLPAASHCVIADAGHTTHLEQPAAFTGAVERFIATRAAELTT